MNKILRGLLRRTAVLAPVATALGILLYGCACSLLVRREIAATPRDPATGVVLGTAAIDLDPDCAGRNPATADGNEAHGAPGRPTSACLLLHGFIGSHQDFGDLGERLRAAGYHVRLARLPGHGTTPIDFADQTPETLYAGALHELRALRAEYDEVTVIGFSMGGTLATLLAAREPVDRLVLIAPYYGVTYAWYYVLPPHVWHQMLGWSMPWLYRWECFTKLNRPEGRTGLYSYKYVPSRGVETLFALGEEARAAGLLESIQCPVLLVMSEGDQASCPVAARAAFARIGSPQKQARWFPGRSNHHLLRDWDGEAAKGAILEFLGERRVDASSQPRGAETDSMASSRS